MHVYRRDWWSAPPGSSPAGLVALVSRSGTPGVAIARRRVNARPAAVAGRFACWRAVSGTPAVHVVAGGGLGQLARPGWRRSGSRGMRRSSRPGSATSRRVPFGGGRRRGDGRAGWRGPPLLAGRIRPSAPRRKPVSLGELAGDPAQARAGPGGRPPSRPPTAGKAPGGRGGWAVTAVGGAQHGRRGDQPLHDQHAEVGRKESPLRPPSRPPTGRSRRTSQAREKKQIRPAGLADPVGRPGHRDELRPAGICGIVADDEQARAGSGPSCV